MPDGVRQVSKLWIGDHVLTVTRDRVRLSEPAEDWVAEDSAGHPHFYGVPGAPYPTLYQVDDGRHSCEGCSDDFERYHLACKLCGERVDPPVEVHPKTDPTYEIDGRRVSRDEAAEFAAQHDGVSPGD